MCEELHAEADSDHWASVGVSAEFLYITLGKGVEDALVQELADRGTSINRVPLTEDLPLARELGGSLVVIGLSANVVATYVVPNGNPPNHSCDPEPGWNAKSSFWC